MALPDSSNTPPIYVTRQPDWDRGVEVTYAHGTGIFTARSGHEQRFRSRKTPVARLSYSQTGLDRANAQQREAFAAQEVARGCVVPFWTEAALLLTALEENAITIDIDPRPDFFAPGQWVYLYNPTADAGQFRTITAAVGRLLMLASAPDALPFEAGAKCYPARLCKRVQGSDGITRRSRRSYIESHIYETL